MPVPRAATISAKPAPRSLATETAMRERFPDYQRRQGFDRLPAGRQVAQVGAVVGREFPHRLLATVAGLPEAQLAQGLNELIASDSPRAERDELTRLRRENKQLRLERDILSKAAAWFARETGTLPSGSSGS